MFDAVRPWLGARTLDELNALAQAADVKTESGRTVRFVVPSTRAESYEMRVYETGCVATRADNLHDWFNALAWLAFPRTKARLNAMHAAAIPLEGGRRGRLRDLLTLFDEGGAIVQCEDARLLSLLRDLRWRELFWDCREAVLASMRFLVLGHAVLEQALRPWPGITCKALLVSRPDDLDAQAAGWLARLPAHATPRDLGPLPIFGYPGWIGESASAAFYEDTRYFRPLQA